MIELEEARAWVLERVAPLPARRVSLDEALGLVLAEPVFSAEAVPSFHNTAMDGFAVRAGDTDAAPVTLKVVGTVAAGDTGDVFVGDGEAARIMTGAPMPAGADAVVMVERTKPAGDPPGSQVVVDTTVGPGNHVRGPGEDVTAGEQVLNAGVELNPGCVGLLAGIGVYEVQAHRRPVVGVVSTGDELVDEPVPLRRGQIRDTNRRALLGLVHQAGFEAVDLGIARDDKTHIEDVFRRGVNECDAVLSSGGVSMGDYDYVKVVLDEIGDMRWMQIAIKPAKPFAFGVIDGVPVFGLPGNPVSSMVSFELLAKPALRAMAGHPADRLGPQLHAAVSRDHLGHRPDGKIHFVRVNVARDEHAVMQVSLAGGQGSHQLAAMARAQALALSPDGAETAPGDPVQVILLQ